MQCSVRDKWYQVSEILGKNMTVNIVFVIPIHVQAALKSSANPSWNGQYGLTYLYDAYLCDVIQWLRRDEADVAAKRTCTIHIHVKPPNDNIEIRPL